MPPWIWPSTSVGLIARPTSWAATIRRTLTVPSVEVDVDLRDLCAEGVGLVRDALAVGVERRGLRVVRAAPEQHAVAGRDRQLAQLDDRRRSRRPRADHPPVRRPRASRRGPASASVRSWRRRSSPAIRVAFPDTNVWREAEVLPASGREVGVGADALDRRRPARPARRRRSGRGSCSSPGRCRSRRRTGRRCRRRGCRPRSRTGWAATCCRCRTTWPPTPTPRRDSADRAGSLCRRAPPRACAVQRGRRASRQAGRPALAAEPLATVAVTRPGAERVPAARNSSGSMPSCAGEVVHQRLVRDRRLRHAEAAEGARPAGRSV